MWCAKKSAKYYQLWVYMWHKKSTWKFTYVDISNSREICNVHIIVWEPPQTLASKKTFHPRISAPLSTSSILYRDQCGYVRMSLADPAEESWSRDGTVSSSWPVWTKNAYRNIQGCRGDIFAKIGLISKEENPDDELRPIKAPLMESAESLFVSSPYEMV